MSSEIKMNVLGIKKWKMVDEETGEERSGCTVFVGQEPEIDSPNLIGWEIMKFSAPLQVFENARIVKMGFPSECLVSVSLRLGAGGKGMMQVLNIRLAE